MARSTGVRRADDWEMAIAARRYYLDDASKSEIADELGMSRFRVARLISEARTRGIARIEIDVPAGLDLDRGDALARAFGIRRAIVATAAAPAGERPDLDQAALARMLGEAAARVVASRVGPDDVLGITWGTTLGGVAGAIDSFAARALVQLVGGVASSALDVNGVELLRRLAAASGAPAYPLHAPFVVGSVEVARQLRADPSLASTLKRFDEVTVALMGVGAWRSRESSLYREFDDATRAGLESAGAVADLGALVLDADGKPVRHPSLERTIAVSEPQLRRVAEVIAVAGGPGKVEAIAAALRSGLVHTLVTDATTADALLP